MTSIIYYTDNTLPEWMLLPLQRQLLKAAQGIPILSVSQEPIAFGENVCIGNIGRSYKSICRQILMALRQSESDIVFFTEHDVVYHQSHFDFKPPTNTAFYYDENVWKLRSSDGQAVYYDTTALSLLVTNREIALDHYEERLDLINRKKLPKGCGHEPGFHPAPKGIGKYRAIKYCADYPSIEIRHENNFTPRDRFDRDKIKNEGWLLADEIPYWGKTKGRFKEFIANLHECVGLYN